MPTLALSDAESFFKILDFCLTGKFDIPQPNDERPRNEAYAELAKLVAEALKTYEWKPSREDDDHTPISFKLHGGSPTKAGSWAKGTYLPGDSDVDLVALMSGKCEPVFFLKTVRPAIVKDLTSKLEKHKDIFANVHGHSPKCIKIEHRNGTSFDVVIALKISSPDDFRELRVGVATNLSASAVEWQLPFIRQQHPIYRDIVRITKIWRDSLDLGRQYPSSFLLELLVLHCFDEAVSKDYALLPSPTDNIGIERLRQRVFLDFIKLIATLGEGLEDNLIAWEEHYDKETINSEAMQHYIDKKRSATGIIAVDPGNPMNDVGWRLKDWKPLQQGAIATLEQVQHEAYLRSRPVASVQGQSTAGTTSHNWHSVATPTAGSNAPKKNKKKNKKKKNKSEDAGLPAVLACPFCAKMHTNGKKCRKHQQRCLLRPDVPSCAHCSKKFATDAVCKLHMDYCPAAKSQYPCGHCHQVKNRKSRGACADHERNCSKQPNAPSCQYCAKLLGSALGLLQHEQTCKKNKP